MLKKLSTLVILVVIGLMMFSMMSFAADDWPTRPIKIFVPFKAGGSADRLARGLAPYLKEELGVPVLVENYPGASTQIGTTMMINNKDAEKGYVLLLSTQLYFSNSIVTQQAPYKLEDFAMVNIEQFDPVDFAVLKDSPYNNLTDLIKAIEANPGKLKMGGIFGGSNYLTAMIMKEELGLDFKVITYSSGSEYRNALLGKQVDFVASSASGDTSIQDQAKVLTVALPEEDLPFKEWPEATSMNAELAKYNLNITNLGAVRFMVASAEFKEKYPERYQKLITAYEKAVNSPEYQAYLAKSGQQSVFHYYGPEKSLEIMEDIHATAVKYKKLLLGSR